MERYFIKHGSENWFLQNKKSKVKWSSSFIKVQEFHNINDALDMLNELNSKKNVYKPYQIDALTPISEEKLKYIVEKYKSRNFNSSDID